MFGDMFKGAKLAVMAHKVISILQRNYSLTTPPDDVIDVLSRVPTSSNEHEMAIWYLSDWVRRIYLDHPKSKSEVTKYIRVAKQARKNGFVQDNACVNALFNAIRMRFGIDPATVSAD